MNVHHCVFRGLKISVVFWTPGSTGHAMTHCLCHDLYGSGVWTSGIASGFEYRNNVVEGCNYVWTAQGGGSALADAGGRGGRQTNAPAAAPPEPVHYRVVNSYFAENRRLTGTGTGAGWSMRTSTRRSSSWSTRRSRTRPSCSRVTRRGEAYCTRLRGRRRRGSGPGCSQVRWHRAEGFAGYDASSTWRTSARACWKDVARPANCSGRHSSGFATASVELAEHVREPVAEVQALDGALLHVPDVVHRDAVDTTSSCGCGNRTATSGSRRGPGSPQGRVLGILPVPEHPQGQSVSPSGGVRCRSSIAPVRV